MLIKVFTLTLLSFVLWITVNNAAVFTAAKDQPYRDSFNVIKSQGFNHTSTLEFIYDAEQARIKHRTNLTLIADDLGTTMCQKFTCDWNCFVNTGKINSKFYTLQFYMYVKSDTTDNMYILCFKTDYRNTFVVVTWDLR